MADHVGELDDRNSCLELFYDKGVAQIIDFGAFDAGNTEVAVDGGPDIADQERITSFGDEEGSVFGFGAARYVFFDGEFGGRVEGNTSSVVRLVGTNLEMRFLK